MILHGADVNGVGGGVDVGDIANSLRFRSVASAYLSRTITTDATSTYFAAVKRGKLGVILPIFDSSIKFNANDTLTAFGLTTTAVFRDPTSWLFIHVSNGGLYVNGVSYGAVTTSALTNPRIGYDGTNYFDGYIARCGCVAGSSSAYTNFGYLNTDINEWVSKSQSAVKAVVDAGGTNSFMLDFDNAAGLTELGYDKSSKGNNWTCNNISLTAGVTYDHMSDVPGNSYATLNRLDPVVSSETITEANLKLSANGIGVSMTRRSTIGITSGKWYWEVVQTAAGNNYARVGVVKDAAGLAGNSQVGYDAYGWGYQGQDGNKYTSGSGAAYGNTWTTNDVIGIAFDADTGSLYFYKNNTVQNSGTAAYTGLTSGPYYPAVSINSTTTVLVLNHGQRPFAYTPPTGFKALCQANLPAIDPASLLDPTDHHIDITVTKSGDTNFTLPWNATTYDTFFEIKRRDAAGDWYQIDGLRGYDKILKSNSTAAETTDANVLGVSGTTCTLKSTLPNGTYVISATKAGLSAARQTNTDGSITSTVSRNVDSGFAIVTYTGTGANATVGHGLGVKPALVIVKCRSNSDTFWPVWHKAITGNEYLLLHTTDAKGAASNVWNSAEPTSSVLNIGTNTATNQSTYTYVAYCYADSPIQNAFSYTGNGSVDGPNLFLNFKCGRWLDKCSSTSENWLVLDSSRDTHNLASKRIFMDANSPEDANGYFDFTAFGVKVRQAAATAGNQSGQTYIGHAWAATTGKYSLAR